MSIAHEEHLTLDELRRRLREVDASVMLVEPRILRRVIKQDRRIAGLGLYVSHSRSYTISSDRLLMIVDRSELDLSPAADLPPIVILLPLPTEHLALDAVSAEKTLSDYWRELFHARVHVEFERLIAEGQLTEETIQARIRDIGPLEFAEIEWVLQREDLLLPPKSGRDIYIEFAAVFLELRYFCPEDLQWYFPAIRDFLRIETLLQHDIDHSSIFTDTRLEGASLQPFRDHADSIELKDDDLTPQDPQQPSPPQFWKMLAKAERAGTLGNQVQAAILRTRATGIALADRIQDTRESARGEIEKLVERLGAVLDLHADESTNWVESLEVMLPNASKGFWSPEARLLYDLQKVCVEHERGVYTLDLVEWIRTWGRVPVRRPLPLLREVLIAKHLRTALRRLSDVRLSGPNRTRLMQLLTSAEQRVEIQMRDRVRPSIVQILDNVGLVPQNIPETVARYKLVEELLDRIADRGFINMGDLRDALSQNNLKLLDLSGVKEFFDGDPLLRADSGLGRELDGVYRRGAIYQRLPQRLSSLAFGTPVGRFLTSYVVLPYGGAYLSIEFGKHLFHKIAGSSAADAAGEPVVVGAARATVDETAVNGFAKTDDATGSDSTKGDSRQTTDSLNRENEQAPVAGAESTEATAARAIDESGSDATTKPATETSATEVASNAVKELVETADRVVNAPLDSLIGSGDESPSTTTSTSVANGLPTKVVHQQDWLQVSLSVAVFGTFLLLLMHNASFRRAIWDLSVSGLQFLRRVVVELPAKILRSKFVQRILQSQWYWVVRSYLIKPAIYSACILMLLHPLARRWDWSFHINVFLALNLFLNSSIGRYADEWLTDVLVRGWHELQARVFMAFGRLVMDISQQLFEWLERVLYSVDEWLRFRRGENRIAVGFKAILSVAWFYVTYVIRFCVTLLIEPQVNPIKHFPVVTVSHKIMLPWVPTLAHYLQTLVSPIVAGTLATAIVLVLPGVCGFLVWELKENWRLYATNRKRRLGAIVVGRHGETLVRLMRPGFHSGTLLKQFGKLRHAAQKSHDSPTQVNPVLQHAARLNQYKKDVERFVERELIAVLALSREWEGLDIRVEQVRLANNRLEVDLGGPEEFGRPVTLVFEDTNGWLVANVRGYHWLKQLSERQRELFAVSLIGLYKRAGVDLVREQIISQFSRSDLELEVSSGSIHLVRKSDRVREATYSLKGDQNWVAPVTSKPSSRWQALERREFMFDRTHLNWTDWVRFWEQERRSNVTNPWLSAERVIQFQPEVFETERAS